MSEWRTLELREVAEVFDGPHATPRKTDEGPWYLSISSLRDGKFDFSASAHLSDSDLPRWTKRVAPQSGDTLFSYETRLGEAAHWSSDVPAALGRRMGLLRPRPEVVDPLYLTYAYLGPDMQSVIREKTLSGSTGVDRIPVGEMPRWPLRIPPLETQRAIAAILGSIDDFIENNRRRVAVLEEMARAIYREWFVKFRYPGHEDVPLVDSARGPIPEGWRVVALSEFAEVTMGHSPKSDFYNEEGLGKPFHQGVRDFGLHFPSTRKWCSVEGRSADEGDILISVRAPVGRINIADVEITIGRGLSAIRAKDGRQALLLGHLREAFAEEDSMGNDGAIFKSLGKAELSAMPILQPPHDIADAAETELSDNLGMIRVLTHSTQRLSSLRDMLLPKLVTGQIDVSELDLDALLEEQVAS